MPILHEEQFLATFLEKLEAGLKKLPDSWEVILSNSGSGDNSFIIAQNFIEGKDAWKLIDAKNEHLSTGESIRRALSEAKKKIILLVFVVRILF